MIKHRSLAAALTSLRPLIGNAAASSEISEAGKWNGSVGGVRGFRSGLGVLNFRASEVCRAQAFAYEVAGDEAALKIARLGIAQEIVTALAAKGITKLFPIQLDRGVDVVVGTPGRVIDLLKRGALNLAEVQFAVLDEADEMLKVGSEHRITTF
ncbi:hypothetical protein QQ045_014944 [Rhodiola kirilowii]